MGRKHAYEAYLPVTLYTNNNDDNNMNIILMYSPVGGVTGSDWIRVFAILLNKLVVAKSAFQNN